VAKKLFMRIISILFFLMFFNQVFSQVGIGTTTPNSSSMLDITAQDKGLLIPRVELINPNLSAPLALHVAGMIIYNTASNAAVSPGFYMNDGTKWMSISAAVSKIDSLTSEINNIKNDVPIKRAIFIAGQSNTYYGYGTPQNLPDITGKKLSQLGRETADLQILPLSFYGTYQHTIQTDKISFGAIFLSRYYDSLQLQYPGRKIELLLVPCGAAGSGWSTDQYPNNSWRTDASYFKDITDRIKWVMNNGYQIDAVLWHQGETDALSSTLNYKDLLKNFIRSLRDFTGNDQLPFIAGQMLPSWVGTDPARIDVQNIINNIQYEIPYTYTVNCSGLTSFDVIHFDANAHIELGKRYLDALSLAKLNSNPSGYSTPLVGEYLVLNQTGSSTFSNIFQAIRNGTLETDNLYSRLGDCWKYKNADGYYHFKLEIVEGGSLVGKLFEWKQKINPFGLRENNYEDKAACKILTNTIGLDVNDQSGQGFSSLVYDSPTNATTFTTLFHGDNRANNYWFSIGLVQSFAGRIPIVQSNDVVTHIHLYCIKD
jgi:hypothetical protein